VSWLGYWQQTYALDQMRRREVEAENVEWWDGQRDRMRARTEMMKEES
jgi:hypothetical protein